jgi:hypothetical protein
MGENRTDEKSPVDDRPEGLEALLASGFDGLSMKITAVEAKTTTLEAGIKLSNARLDWVENKSDKIGSKIDFMCSNIATKEDIARFQAIFDIELQKFQQNTENNFARLRKDIECFESASQNNFKNSESASKNSFNNTESASTNNFQNSESEFKKDFNNSESSSQDNFNIFQFASQNNFKHFDSDLDNNFARLMSILYDSKMNSISKFDDLKKLFMAIFVVTMAVLFSYLLNH